MIAGPETDARLECLFSQEVIETRVAAMAAEINMAYAKTDELVVIGVLKGSFIFMADLIRHITVPCQTEFVRLASYGDGQTSSGTVRAVDLSLPDLNGKDVLIVEDIIDTGLTLQFFLDYIRKVHIPNSLSVAVLLDKAEMRQKHVKVQFTGFEISNHFVVGYGLDDAGRYRNLPYIARMRNA